MMNNRNPRPGGPKEPLGWQTDAAAGVIGQAPQARGNTMLPAFMPGQQDALAAQLNQGFGGGASEWSGMLGNLYSPSKLFGDFKYGKIDGGRGSNGGKDGIDLTREERQIAQPWIPTNGAFRNPQQEIDFRALDPKIRRYLLAQWGVGG